MNRSQRPESLVFAPGDVIAEKYQVTRQLAVGGMGVVYSCIDVMLDRAVALKVIHPGIAADESIRARFVLEARTLAQLANPHVTRVFDCGFTETGQPYMVMELLDGTDLYSVLRARGPLAAERVARYALQVCRGLRDAHALGIVHRDLKPENLFLTRSRNGAELVKIIDFGISKQCSPSRRSLTQPSMNVGSPQYMPPEQIRSPSTVDGRADIWSLGVVLYELLCGRLPFAGATLPELCNAVFSAPLPRMPARVPEELESIVRRCLERDVTLRYADVDELARALKSFLDPKLEISVTERPLEATPTWVSLSFRPKRSRAGLRSRGGGALLALCAFSLGVAISGWGAARIGFLRLPAEPPHAVLAPVWHAVASLPPDPLEITDAELGSAPLLPSRSAPLELSPRERALSPRELAVPGAAPTRPPARARAPLDTPRPPAPPRPIPAGQ